MLYIFFKIVLCSSLFIGVYHLLLEKEKMHHFNRFFLLFSLAFAYTVPFISITAKGPVTTESPQLIFEETTQQILSLPAKEEAFEWTNILWIIYGAITLMLLVKAFLSILKIRNIKGKVRYQEGYKIIISENNLSPFTFGKTIYLGKNYLINDQIDPRIFLHEKSHLDQKHSWDLFLIEFLKVITWFNPALFFYRRAMITNHEFLADDRVLKNNFNIKDYQNLILDEIIDSQKFDFTHSFNFNNTKKRFIMMNTKKTKFAGLKKAITIPLLITAFALFVQKTYASNYVSGNGTPMEEYAVESFSTLQEISSKQSRKDHQSITDTIRPTKKANVKKAKINKNSAPPPPSPPRVEKNGSKKANMSGDQNIPPPPPPASTSFIQAEFPQGINEFRNKVAKNFNGSVFKGDEGRLQSNVFISINAEGTVEKVVADGKNKLFNDESVRAIKASTENINWKPALADGKPAPTVFKLPLAMIFENKKK
ncbi:M56 family metallopeptidase [Chryseobacterium sp. Chry.R1]|uniref:M56 family metallopeptidase n=1 Tax=Chryseobacterium sp. Chry.R1 TaxID=3139392 RepID=UPI0031FA1DEF